MLRKGLILASFGIFCLFFIQPSTAEAEKNLYVYVDDLPSWADYASNVMYESTKAWEDANPDLKFYVSSTPSEADFRVQWVKEFGVEHVGFALGNQFIEVGLGDSDCKGNWQPYSTEYVNNIMKHEIGHILGFGHSSDPDDIMYPIALNKEYGLVTEEFTLTNNYGQFISFCTFKDITSFNYHISSDDPTYGFDAYVVPSIDSFDDWKDGKPFSYYSDPECFGENYLSYGGACEGVDGSGGLMIIIGNTQTNPLTKLTVNIQETSSAPKVSAPTIQPTPTPIPTQPTPIPIPTPTPPTPTPTPPTSTGYGTLEVEKEEYTVSYSQNQLVKVSGESYVTQRGDRVSVVFTYPDGSTNGNKIVPTKDGYFETFLNLDNQSPKGNYEVLASANAKIIGIVHFTVSAQGLSGINPSSNEADEESTILEDTLSDLTKDSDGDTIYDSYDQCTWDKENFNGYKDHDGCPDSKPVTNDWELKSSKSQNQVNSKILSLKPGLTTAERSLHEAEFSSSAAQKELDLAWTSLGQAKKFLNDSEITQKEGKELMSDLRFEDAYHKFQYSLDKAEKIDAYLLEITDHLNNAETLESAYTEGSEQKENNEKTCFLFFCW